MQKIPEIRFIDQNALAIARERIAGWFRDAALTHELFVQGMAEGGAHIFRLLTNQEWEEKKDDEMKRLANAVINQLLQAGILTEG